MEFSIWPRASRTRAGASAPGPVTATALPPDDHVHSEWSWDAPSGSMEATCARAVELGLPSIAFTEHVDFTRWVIRPEREAPYIRDRGWVGPDDRFDPPPLDVQGYRACLERCRERFGDLRIVSGVELGEPHWFGRRIEALLAGGAYERVLGSLHSVELGGEPWIAGELLGEDAPEGLGAHGVVRRYLAGALTMVESCGDFAVLAHLDYPLRYWPAEAGSLTVSDFEDEFRAVLRALARSGRALEVNTVVPLPAEIVRWWHEAGGEAVSFGSDAHAPGALARGFAEAAAMVESRGFRPGRHPHDFWRRA